MLNPVAPEIELVDLLHIIPALARKFGQDHVLREGVASLIEGATNLLNGDWGKRLDMEECRKVLQRTATSIGYDIDTERFGDAAVYDGHSPAVAHR